VARCGEPRIYEVLDEAISRRAPPRLGQSGACRALSLYFEYDGTPFVGWQRQENGLSVQEVLEGAPQCDDRRAS